MKAKTYILMKDLPDYKAGELFSTEDGKLYVSHSVDEDGTVGKWPARFVENNLTWFKLKEEEVPFNWTTELVVEVIKDMQKDGGDRVFDYDLYIKNFIKARTPEPEPTPQNIKEEKPVLFITEDGQPAYIGCRYWLLCVISENWPINETIMRQELATPPSYFKYFSTKEAAETYVLNNKPCLSINDVKEVCDSNKFYNRQALINFLTKKIKQ